MDTRALGRIERLNYILGGIAAAAAALLLTKEQALGVLVGVVIGSLNFSMIKRIATRWISEAAKGEGQKGSMSGYFLVPKMMLLIAAVFLALRFLPIAPAYLAMGFSIFLLSIVIETARSLTGQAQTTGDEDAQTDDA